ncbi:MAG: hypothetical protein ACE5IJ_10885 [Thermoplasmata archaeon]
MTEEKMWLIWALPQGIEPSELFFGVFKHKGDAKLVAEEADSPRRVRSLRY